MALRKPLQVGDVGVVTNDVRKAPKWEGEVTKVGRRWATVVNVGGRWPTDAKFDIVTGFQDAGKYTSTTRFVTVEQAEHELLVKQAWDVILKAGFNRFKRVSDELVLAVAKTIEEMS